MTWQHKHWKISPKLASNSWNRPLWSWHRNHAKLAIVWHCGYLKSICTNGPIHPFYFVTLNKTKNTTVQIIIHHYTWVLSITIKFLKQLTPPWEVLGIEKLRKSRKLKKKPPGKPLRVADIKQAHKNRQSTNLHYRNNQSTVNDKLTKWSRSFVTIATVNQQEWPNIFELRYRKISSEWGLLPFFSYNSDPTMGSLYHVDVIASITLVNTKLGKQNCSDVYQLCILQWIKLYTPPVQRPQYFNMVHFSTTWVTKKSS